MRIFKRVFPWSLVLAVVGMILTGAGGAKAQVSINSTSQNRATLPAASVGEEPFTNLNNFRVLAVNDLGMHCGDLDHRVASILPPFNVIHAQVVGRAATPSILTDAQASVVYSAASNPKDPALQRTPLAPIFKTNFWGSNPRTGNTLAFDAYNPFYPPGILALFPLDGDIGLPVPDVERLYLGDGQLAADQQAMPSVNTISPLDRRAYALNKPQPFARFDADLPFFINFPFGYTLTGVNWFAADGIPIAPFDDAGRSNSYPLMRIQARDPVNPNRTLASVDTVVPVAAEADCYRCHTSGADGGNGQAACLPGVDANCPAEGAPSNRSGTAFNVVQASEDPSSTRVPAEVSREWAADVNIVRLHDARHSTNLDASRPVVCQRCHYTPALDLAHVGPKGPGDADANGREQKNHRTNSRVLHTFHGRIDLFRARMPAPDDPRRLNAQGNPVINARVTNVLNRTCYQCHPGRNTKCLRGAMFNGGLVCQDCHGNMLQVGNDFSLRFPTTPYPDGIDLTRRVPWANEPGCQSCHTGDVLNTLAGTDPSLIPAKDGIRLLQAYRKGNAKATPIERPASRFAENQIGAQRVLYRLSKESHSGLSCQACHGSTHAEWPVQPSAGATVANDNMAAIQLQGHAGKIMECTVCHTPGSLPVSLDGPHGMHAVNDQRWVQGHEGFLQTTPLNTCRACHGRNGEGTVLAKSPVARTFTVEGQARRIARNQLVSCDVCHGNPL